MRGLPSLQRCLWAWMRPPCSGLPSAVSLLLSLSLPFPVPGNNTLWWLMKLEGTPGFVLRSIRGGQHENPASLHLQVGWSCTLVPLFGSRLSLGSWWVLFLARPDSNFVLNTKSFPSCCSRAFFLRFYHHTVPSHAHPHPLPHAWDPAGSPHPSSSAGSPTYLRKLKPSRGTFGPFLPSLGGLGEGISMRFAPVRAAFRPWVLARALPRQACNGCPMPVPHSLHKSCRLQGIRGKRRNWYSKLLACKERTVVMRDSRQLVIQEQQQSAPEAAPCDRPG